MTTLMSSTNFHVFSMFVFLLLVETSFQQSGRSGPQRVPEAQRHCAFSTYCLDRMYIKNKGPLPVVSSKKAYK